MLMGICMSLGIGFGGEFHRWGRFGLCLEFCVGSLALVDEGGVGVAGGFGDFCGYFSVAGDFAGVVCV